MCIRDRCEVRALTRRHHSDDDVADLLPGLDIPVGLDDLLERVAPVDQGAEPPGRDAFAQVLDDLLVLDRRREHDPPTTGQPRHHRQDGVLGPRSEVGRQVQAARLQQRAAPSDRALPDRVEDDVVLVVVLREFHRVAVDDPVGPQPAHELDVRRPAHGGYPRAEVREQLDGGAADRARRAVDEHILAAADAGLPDDGQRVVRTLGARGDVLEGQTAGDCRDRPVLRDRQELGMRAEPRAVAEHPVSGGEPGHPRADGLDDPRELVAEIVARGRTSPVSARMTNGFAARKPQSVRFTVVACTATRTSPGPTSWTGTSVMCTTSGGPYVVRTAALMALTVTAVERPVRRLPGIRRRRFGDGLDRVGRNDGEQGSTCRWSRWRSSSTGSSGGPAPAARSPQRRSRPRRPLRPATGREWRRSAPTCSAANTCRWSGRPNAWPTASAPRSRPAIWPGCCRLPPTGWRSSKRWPARSWPARRWCTSTRPGVESPPRCGRCT